MSKKENMKRLNFDFSNAAIVELDRLVTITRAASRAEVVRRAVTLYYRLEKLYKDGGRLVFRGNDGSEVDVAVV